MSLRLPPGTSMCLQPFYGLLATVRGGEGLGLLQAAYCTYREVTESLGPPRSPSSFAEPTMGGGGVVRRAFSGPSRAGQPLATCTHILLDA